MTEVAATVGILGATGYTGGELVRLLARHPGVRLTAVTSERNAGRPLTTAFPHLRMAEALVCQPLEVGTVAASCQVVFCALPHLASMTVVPELLAAGCRVIDLSADFRLKDPRMYEAWYGEPHGAPQWLPSAVYGLPELYGEAIAASKLVANPGCYPTSVLLALAPLLTEGLLDPEVLIIDSKSGVSGAGRAAAQGSLYCEVAEGFRPYKVVGHRHTPEIEQELSRLAGRELKVRFTPHLVPQSRGILTTCYGRPLVSRPAAFWQELFEHWYRHSPFVRVLPAGDYPSTAFVRGSNHADLAVVWDERTGWLVVLSAIDNLVKGAAGQAVQNLNLMLGVPEELGLAQLPLFP